jgi:cation-transporting ATPase E
MPSTILALQPNKEKIKGSFIGNIISNCFTQALCLVLTVLVIYLLSSKNIPGLDLSNDTEVNSICVIAITYVGFIILINICRPFNALRTAIVVVSGVCITLAFSIPEISTLIGVSNQFKDFDIVKQLFTLCIILAIVPIERAFADLIRNISLRGTVGTTKKVLLKGQKDCK